MDFKTPAKIAHFYLAVIMFALSTLQIIGGMVYSHIILKKPNNKHAKMIRMGHIINGSTLYLLAKANLFIGMLMGKWAKYTVYLIILTVVTFSLRTIQEVYERVVNILKKRQNRKLNLSDSRASNHQTLLELLNANSMHIYMCLFTFYLFSSDT